jgi:hypothetical protein
MITNLRTQNFKSWKDTGDLRLSPLTGLFGTNSSGKSSILQVLLMLKQTVESSDVNRVLHLGGDLKSFVDLGTFYDIIHCHETARTLAFSVTWGPSGVNRSAGRGPNHFVAEVDQRQGRIVVSRFAYDNKDGYRAGVELGLDGKYASFEDDEAPRISGSPLRFYRFPPDQASSPPTAGWLMSFELEQFFQELSYLGPLRVPPARWYLFGGAAPRDVGRDGAETVQALLASSLSVTEKVAKQLAKMNLAHSFILKPIGRDRRDHEVLIKTTEESPEVLLTDVGFGISQILPVLVLCYYVPEGTTLLIEQPELHLHPSAQSVLADVFIDVVKNRKLQIIFESHSEHLLRRIQRRIAEGELPAKDASMYFCQIEKGESKANELQLTEDGFIKNWPQDFFGDDMGDLVAMTEASIERKRR